MPNHKFDCVVVGSGISGIAAAIACAENDKKVVVLDRNPIMGGTSVNANVGTICGAYYRSHQSAKPSGNIFTKKVLDTLSQASGIGKVFHHQNGLHIIPYEWSALLEIYKNWVNQFGFEVWMNAELKSVELTGNRIQSLMIIKEGKEQTVLIDSVIDCSGNAIVSQLTELETIKDESYQAASQVFRLTNVQSSNEFSLNISIQRALLKQRLHNRMVSVVPASLREGHVNLKLTLSNIITDNTSSQNIFNDASHQIQAIVNVLISEVESMQHASLEKIFPMPGIRVQKRTNGKYILTEGDILQCKKFDDGVAIGSWPIEEWRTDGSLNMEYFPEENGYEIPARCLQSCFIENLFMGGKNISATSKAIASARVMGTAWQTGYAAGKLAVSTNLNSTIKELHAGLF